MVVIAFFVGLYFVAAIALEIGHNKGTSKMMYFIALALALTAALFFGHNYVTDRFTTGYVAAGVIAALAVYAAWKGYQESPPSQKRRFRRTYSS